MGVRRICSVLSSNAVLEMKLPTTINTTERLSISNPCVPVHNFLLGIPLEVETRELLNFGVMISLPLMGAAIP